ncbi:RND superfamily putative drug exporter [Glaciihabitans tibetensis]|uniref:RND superfamily putative drug exporter n=1 Tax=Glaciihabitans tibetensis TaxID=1266600 RepID=A0A2T0VI95_9MICO|nr:MMPL family transporter [Glaciihabitans tibetensis]PRY69951.1 RND superfamily putative drug exporter [Glaciihabitans tibetensis]
MRRLTDFLTGRATSWIVLVVTLLAAGAVFALGSGTDSETGPGAGLPDSAESVRVSQAQEGLPSADSTSAILVYSNGGDELSAPELTAITAASANLAGLSSEGFVPPPTVSDDGSTALVIVPLDVEEDVAIQTERADELRALANTDLPNGLSALLTGPEGFTVDITAVFAGADFTLLLTTVIVVAILLIVTYRSPWLWLVPLIVIGIADGIAGIVATRVAAAIGITLDASTTGILSVLVFGAGTNYALLLIARYRDELRTHEDRRAAMSTALRGAGPAVLASGSTVVLSLLTLLFAQLTGNRALGIACATGIVIAMLFALVVLPAALVLFGRGLFWPYIPRFGSADPSAKGVWARLGARVARRPLAVAAIGVMILGGLSVGVTQLRTGLAQTEVFISEPESVRGQNLIAESFAAGSGSPTTVIVNSAFADEAVDVASAVPGVDAATIGESDGTITEISVVLAAAAETEEAFDTVRALRADLGALDGADALVGGSDAQALDVSTATLADQNLVIPLILALVFLVLMILLRSLLAPLLLLFTVVASYFASLGLSWVLFRTVFDFPAMDTNVVLLSFLFLVALGVDYNIFLVTRANEEAKLVGTRAGMIRALSATGGVITSAGILLAAVFAVLGVLPLITLTQIGIIVCVGVLLDTLLVRTVIVPALAFISGDGFWWPRKLMPRS